MIKKLLTSIFISATVMLSSGLTDSLSARAADNSFQVARKADKKPDMAKDKADKKEVKTEKKEEKKADKKEDKKTEKKAVMVNINTASEAELKKLPGIGDKLAKEIVKYRTSKGKFKTVSDLEKVPGIGKKTIEKLKKMASI